MAFLARWFFRAWLFWVAGSLTCAGFARADETQTNSEQTDDARADRQPPARYEISINGENFVVPADRQVTLKSETHKGTVYRVAVRPAQYQTYRLNHVQFDYHDSFELSDDHKPSGRGLTLKHPLGFVAVLTELGGPLPADAIDSSLQLLVKATEKGLRGSDISHLTIDKPQRQKFEGVTLSGVNLSYLDVKGTEQNSLVYLAVGKKFSCSCIVQCPSELRDDAIELIQNTLESLAPR